MKRMGWFFTGMYLMGIIITIKMSYLNLGTPEQRSLIGVIGVIGICACVYFLRDNCSSYTENVVKENKNGN